MRRHARKNVGRAAAHAATEIKRTLTGNRTGNRYRVPGTRRNYTASAPGQPPAVRTGALRASITAGALRESPAGVSAQVGSAGLKPPYGLFLESAKKARRRRPFIEPTMRRIEGALKRILSSGWDGLER